MPMVVNDIMKVNAVGEIGANDRVAENVYHLKATTVNDGSDNTVRADLKEYVEGIYNVILQDLSTDWFLRRIRMENVTQQLVLEDETSALTGSDAGDILPTQTCAFLWAKTATKRVMGRKFFAGYTETNNQSDGSILPAAVARLELAGDAYHFPFLATSTNAYDTGVFRLDAPGPPATGTFFPFTGDEVAAFWRTQRRRTSRSAN